jgi:hypothetical protein
VHPLQPTHRAKYALAMQRSLSAQCWHVRQLRQLAQCEQSLQSSQPTQCWQRVRLTHPLQNVHSLHPWQSSQAMLAALLRSRGDERRRRSAASNVAPLSWPLSMVSLAL